MTLDNLSVNTVSTTEPIRWYELMHQLDMAQSFHYVGDTRDICRRKIICHVHNVLSSAPFWLQTIYRIIRY